MDADSRRGLTVYVMCSDMGPDQAKCARMITQQLEPERTTLFFHIPCFLHQIHLIVRMSLSKFPTYFSSCAKIVNTWRSWGHARKIQAAWEHLFGSKRAKETTSSLPPRPLRGRWGSIEGIESFLIHCGRDELVQVYEFALLKKAKSVLEELEKHKSNADDEETRSYQMQVGKWTVEAVQALKDDSFWASLIIGKASRGPIAHAMFFLMAQNKKNDEEESRYLTIVNFVTSLVPRVQIDFHHLLKSPEPWYDLMSLEGGHDGRTQGELFNTANFSTLLCYADFTRRIVERTVSFPLKLAWILHRPETTCDQRRRVAQEVLDVSSSVHEGLPPLPPNAPSSDIVSQSIQQHVAKIGVKFESELRYCIDTGLLHPHMKLFVQMLLQVMRLDTQAVEGLNSTIKLMCRAAPNLHVPLLSARLNIKTHVRQYGCSVADRSCLVDDAVVGHQRTKEWLAEKQVAKASRWSMPAIQDEVDQCDKLPVEDRKESRKATLLVPNSKPPSRRRNAGNSDMCFAKMLLLLQSSVHKKDFSMKPTPGICFCFFGVYLPESSGSVLDDDVPITQSIVLFTGVITMQHYSKLMWAKCVLMSEDGELLDPNITKSSLGGDKKFYLKVHTPVEYLDSLKVMSNLHQRCTSKLVGIDAEVWRVSWGHEGCIGEGQVLKRISLDCNLIWGCKCGARPPRPSAYRVSQEKRKTHHDGQVTYATDEELLEGLAQDLLSRLDLNDDAVEETVDGQGDTDADGTTKDNFTPPDPDIERLLEQAGSVCKVLPTSFLSLELTGNQRFVYCVFMFHMFSFVLEHVERFLKETKVVVEQVGCPHHLHQQPHRVVLVVG